jgi:transcriptional regulator with XRE-family HTH domain
MPVRNEVMGKRIRKLRGNRTLEEFAGLVGVTAPAIQRYEAGRIPRTDILMKIARVGKQSVEWLLHGEREGMREAVAEPQYSYGNFSRRDRRLLKSLEELLQKGDPEINAHLRHQVALLLKLKETGAKKTS